MYSIRWLLQVARDGLSDLLPAVRRAFNDNPDDDRLELVYGARPRVRIVLIALLGMAAGMAVSRFAPLPEVASEINWPAVLIGALHAALIRRYLFQSSQVAVEDFPWLAASLAPAMALLMVSAAGASVLESAQATDANGVPGIGLLLVAVTDAIGVAAALTVAVAALCFSRQWLRALMDLAVRLLVFRIMVWVTALVLLDIGIVGPIVVGMLGGIFNLHVPPWLPELVDQISYAALLSVVYLAVIGATWMVCRRGFASLLQTGHVDILATVAKMANDPSRAEKKKRKAAAKAARRAARRNPR